MAIGDLKDVLHKIKVKLYPNYLPQVKGAYLARTDNEATLSVEEICTTLINRGGYVGKFSELVDTVKQFIDEVAYQLCDGYAVSMGYFAIHPNVGGTFDSEREAHDHKKHPITFRFHALKQLRELSKAIVVEILGIADSPAYIDEFIDYEADSRNTHFVPGDQFALLGHMIKAAGDDPGVGVFLVPVDDPSQAVKITRIAENSPSRVTGIMPTSNHLRNRIEVRTQFSGSGDRFLTSLRVLTSPFILEEL
jgi:hypothetical protein